MVAKGGGKGKGKSKGGKGGHVEEAKKPTWNAKVKNDGPSTPRVEDTPSPPKRSAIAPPGYKNPPAKAEAEVPTSTLSASASEFTFAAGAEEFVPGQWAGFSSTAAEFNPDQVADFYPEQEYDNQGWGQQQMSWQGPYAQWGAPAYNQAPMVNPLFNLDEYTDSDSDDSVRPSPVSNNATSTLAKDTTTPPAAAPVSQVTNNGNNVSKPPGSPKVVSPASPKAVSPKSPKAPTSPKVISPSASPKGLSPKAHGQMSPNNNRNSPMLDAKFFDDPQEDFDSEDDDFALGRDKFQSFDETPHHAGGAVTHELPNLSMSDELERHEVLQRWLDYYEDDRDSVALRSAFQRWIEVSNGDCIPLVTEWLVRMGLEDYKKSRSVLEALSHLLSDDDLSMDLVEAHLAEYSPEALEDLALDNPKAREFVKELLTLEPAADSQEVAVKPQPSANSNSKKQESHSSVGPDGVSSYSRNKLLALGIKLKELGEIQKHTGAAWTTKEASGLCAPTPAWQKNYTPQASPGGGEWRREAQRNFDIRKKSDMNSKKLKGGPKLQLEVSENSWASQVKKRKEEEDVNDLSDENFVREMRLTLNKLTIEKFDRLSDHLIDLIAQSTRPNRGIPVLMQMVFEKATTQHHFIDMYTNLCVKLHRWLTANEQIITSESQSNFKRILLNQCQNSFEQYLEPPEGFEGLLGDELYEAQVKYKTKMLGNIKLVGELLRHGMLAPKIALSVAADLSKDDPIVREERLETLAVFLETVGPSLDDTTWTHHAQFDAIFKQVEEMCSRHARNPPPPRIKCLLKDVLDLRRDKWRNTKKAKVKNSEGPSTIDEVHQQAKVEAQQEISRGKELKGKGSDRRSRGDDSVRGRGGSTASPSHGTWRERDDNDRHSPATSSSATAHPWKVKEDPKQKGDKTPGASPMSKENEAARKRELLVKFHKEAAACVKEICQSVKGGGTPDINSVVQRIRACSLPQEHFCDESINLLARMVDEPRKEQRSQLFVFLKSLYAEKVFSPPELLNQAVSNFLKDAFRDPLSVDPPDLREIALQELIPILGVRPNALSLPRELADAAHY